MALVPTNSVVIPVYCNSGSIPDLLNALANLHHALAGDLEVVFVVDGSPDDSHHKLSALLPDQPFPSQLLLLSRNFGAFSAIRRGLVEAGGSYIGVMAADMQEPPELMLNFFSALSSRPVDVVFGLRVGRADPIGTRLASKLFWSTYRLFVQPDVPAGGVDVFALTSDFRDRLVSMEEANSSLLGLLFWLGGRREFIPYSRRVRLHGKSGWTLRKKVTYLMDSVFAFSDLPVRILVALGVIGMSTSATLGSVVFLARMLGLFSTPGYAGSMLTILFFGALNTFGLGIVGNYAWRAYENTKQRPLNIVSTRTSFPGRPT
jgi:glycosyltransferase involved in cell wall biosynthesis